MKHIVATGRKRKFHVKTANTFSGTTKYIEGTDLSAKLKKSRLKYRDAAELVATVAEALHCAHKQDCDDYWTLRRQIRLQRLVRFLSLIHI